MYDDNRHIIWKHSAPEVPHALSPTLRSLLAGAQVVYAIRMPDGAIKIGCTKNLANRKAMLHGEILAFRRGDFDAERTIHASLKQHVVRGREYYRPTPEVLAVVNDMRDDFNLPHLAA